MRKITDTAIAVQIATIAYISGAFERLRRDERGQGSVEYVGIIVVVVAIVSLIVGLIANSGIGTAIIDAITAQIDKVKVLGP